MGNNVQIVKCEICGKEFDKSNRRNKSIHNLCSNKCKYEFLGNINRKHGYSYKTDLYGVWKSLKQRCYNPNDPRYKDYGGRGISICGEWKNNFKQFYDWCMLNGYSNEKLPSGRNKLTIDRINNNGNYEPSNCRWVDDYVQANNKRASIPKEKKFAICAICGEPFIKKRSKQITCSKKCGQKHQYLTVKEKYKDAHKKRCPICHNIFEDKSGHFNKVKFCSKKCADIAKSPIWEFQGKSLRVLEWAEEIGINAHCLFHRKEMGWTIEEILTTPKGAKRKTN